MTRLQTKAPSARGKPDARLPFSELLICLACVTALSAAFVFFCQRRGYTLYYGDASAHVNIARRVVDSRRPGYEQLGTVWLPLPHVLMLPFVKRDKWWRSGLAGAIPAAAFFVAGAVFLYAAVRRATGSRAGALTAAAVLALNPNLLYLQATPMTEPIFLGCFAATVFFCVRFQESPQSWCVLCAGVAALAGTLTRYEGWFVIPFFALFFLTAGSLKHTLLFGAIASLGPLYWLGHNFYLYSDPLEFYRGPYSAQAIYTRALAQGLKPYPGDHDWHEAWTYYKEAMQLAMGRPLLWIAPLGGVLAVLRKSARPLLLLALPIPFYLASLHSGGTPIFVPKLYPFTYYNTRYALAALPAFAAAAGIVAAAWPAPWLRAVTAASLLAVCLGGWVLHPGVESWICWKESQVNSEGRRQWTSQAAAFFRKNYGRGDGVLTASGDVTAIYREAGIPLRENLSDGPQFEGAVARPDVFSHEKWVVAIAGDQISFNLTSPKRFAAWYERVAAFSGEREPVIEIYRRIK